MNSAHDLGGMHGFPSISQSDIESAKDGNFSEPWEEKVFAMTLACGMLGQWNLDQSRFARENVDPGHYLTSPYYEHWLDGLEALLVEKGLVAVDELETGKAQAPSALKSVQKEDIALMLKRGGPTTLPSQSAPIFKVGDNVTVANFHPRSHTRSPRYIRGKTGQVAAYHGSHVFPDDHAKSGQKTAAHLYNVRFEAQMLWGEQDADKNSVLFVDVFEPYLLVEPTL